jgi:hypothetical protein
MITGQFGLLEGTMQIKPVVTKLTAEISWRKRKTEERGVNEKKL